MSTTHLAEVPVPSADDMAALIEEVWSSFLDAADVPVAFEPFPVDADATAGHWSAAVTVSGPAPCVVTIAVPAAGATSLTRHLLQLDEPTTEDVADSIGELVNVIGGNLKSLLPGPSTLSLPIATTGTIAHSSLTTQECRLDTSLAGHRVTVTVHAPSADTRTGTEDGVSPLTTATTTSEHTHEDPDR